MNDLTELAVKAGKGDKAALHELVTNDEFRKKVENYCRFLCGSNNQNQIEWQDLAQDVYSRILKNELRKFRGRASPVTWSRVIAMKLYRDRVQQDIVSSKHNRLTQHRTESQENQAREASLKGAIERLSPRRREILYLTMVKGVSAVLVARKLGLSKSMVYEELEVIQKMLVNSVEDFDIEWLIDRGGQSNKGQEIL